MAGQVTVTAHPEYRANLKIYNKILDFIDGSRELVCCAGYIWPYETESERSVDAKKSFAARVQRTYNKNITKPYLDIHLAHLSQPIQCDALKDGVMSDASEDITGFGDSLEEFSRELLYYYLSHGRVCVLTEMPQDVGSTPAEADAIGARSFSYIYPATHLLYWEFFRTGPKKGQLRRLTLLEEPEVIDGKIVKRAIDYYYEPNATEYSWRKLRLGESADQNVASTEYDRNRLDSGTYTFDVIESGQGTLENIPGVIWGKGLSDSLMRQHAEYNEAVLNLQSTVTETIYNQGFQRVIIVGDINTDQLSKAGSGRVWAFKGQNLSVSNIDPGNPEAAMKEITNLEVLNFKHGLMLNSQLLDDTRNVQSAESKALDAKSRVAEYNRITDGLEDTLEKVLENHAEFEGVDTEISVVIGRDFELADPAAEALIRGQITSLARELRLTEVQKEVLKSLVLTMAVVPKEDQKEEDRRQELLDAIEAAQVQEEEEQPLFGLPSLAT